VLLVACTSPDIRDRSDTGPDDGGLGDAGDVSADAGTAEQDSGGGELDRGELRLTIGVDHACGLFPDGRLRCWGSNAEGQSDLPFGFVKDVAAGDFHTCVLDEAGELICAGRNRDNQRANEVGPYIAVAAGDAHTCALAPDGKAECWGKNEDGQAEPPDVAFSQITAGTEFTCGIRRSDREVECWGSDSANRSSPPRGVSFVSIDAGRAHVCGRTTAEQRAGPLVSIFAGENATCFVPEQGNLVCHICGPAGQRVLLEPPADFL
jgi:alpha-tubulin suppressor-like RCC1 family protein